MALSFVGDASNSAEEGDVTLTFPGGIAEGDVVYVGGGVGTSVDADQAAVTSGYSELFELYVNDTSDANFAAFRKVMGATPDSTGAFDAAAGSSRVFVAHVWRGADTTTPEDVTATTDGAGNGGVIDSPSIEPVTDGAVVLTLGLSATPQAQALDTPTEPSGYGNAVFIGRTGVSGTHRNATTVMASKVIASAAAEDPAAWGAMTTNGQCSWAAGSVAIRPAAGEGPTDFEATGDLDAQSATLSGAAVVGRVATGSLSAQSASIAGAAIRDRLASGALSAQLAQISGSADVSGATDFEATGSLVAQSASLAGSVIINRVAVGVLGAPAASISGDATSSATQPTGQVDTPSFFGAPAWHYLKHRSEYRAAWLLSEEEEVKEAVEGQQQAAQIDEFLEGLRDLEGFDARQRAYLEEHARIAKRIEKVIARIEREREQELENDDMEVVSFVMKGL